MNNKMSIEKFAAFLDGNLQSKEMVDVYLHINEDSDMRNIMEAVDIFDNEGMDMGVINENISKEIFSETFELPQISYYDDANDIFLEQDYENIYMQSSRVTNGAEYNDISFKKLTPDDIQQQYPDTCAIKSQQIILESHDVNVSEEELVNESIENGWYKPGTGGTSPADVGNLLENKGMTVGRFINASIEDIALELAQGHHIIVGVDSGELWNPGGWETFEDFLNSGGADHALIVSGIQLNPLTAEREVILTDPGTGEIARTYTIEQFEDAWSDSDNFMVIAE